MPDAQPHPNVALIERLYLAFEAVDLEAIAAVISPDVEIRQTDELPWGGEFHGHDGLLQFFGLLRDTITSSVTTQVVFAAGDDVVQVGRTAGTVNATGAPFDVDEVHVFTVRDGQVVRFEARIDTPAMLQALRADPN
jgi:ketosteroid isomerase-like protein